MQAGRVIKSLERNNIPAIYIKTKEEAVEKALSLIPKGSKVGHGGSLTLKQIGIIDALRAGDFRFIDFTKPEINQEEREKLFKESLLADVFLMSTNALTLDGKLVNIDGNGNRVAALSYGPSKVIIVAGVNKIVVDYEAAIQRIKNYVTPIHAKRRDRPLPCAETGSCVDCRVELRSCNIVTIIEHQRRTDRITVIICGEELGI
ncbi:MAG: lactate utilization protein [Dehalococcoidia bacterium]|nr:MAG: lactate utilization protein [Dehalococcoidia bacterium]